MHYVLCDASSELPLSHHCAPQGQQVFDEIFGKNGTRRLFVFFYSRNLIGKPFDN